MTALLEKESKRATFEWDAFAKRCGAFLNWDDLSSAQQEEATLLAEKQGERLRPIFAKLKLI